MHEQSTLHPTSHPSTECMPNINDVIWFDFVTISGCRRHRWNNNNNNAINNQKHTASHFILWRCALVLVRFEYERTLFFFFFFFLFFALIDVVCTQNEMRQKAVDSLYSVRSVQCDRYMCVYISKVLRKLSECAAFISFYPTGAEDAAF